MEVSRKASCKSERGQEEEGLGLRGGGRGQDRRCCGWGTEPVSLGALAGLLQHPVAVQRRGQE